MVRAGAAVRCFGLEHARAPRLRSAAESAVVLEEPHRAPPVVKTKCVAAACSPLEIAFDDLAVGSHRCGD